MLKLKQKLEGKSGKELSQNVFISSNTKDEFEQPQEPDSQRSEEPTDIIATPSRKPRPAWTSPTTLDSPPSLSIAESPVSPDTQTASPDQMASPDTQTASPDGRLSPIQSQIPDTPASPDGPSSPESALVIQDTPSSPDNSPSQDSNFVFAKPLKQIPTIPIKADSTRNEQDAQPPQAPVPSEPKKNVDPRRRDPRNRNKEPAKVIPVTKSPYDPSSIPNVEISSSNLISSSENNTPAYMSNLVSNLPPPMWKQQNPPPRFEIPSSLPHQRLPSNFQQMPTHHMQQHRMSHPGMQIPIQGQRMVGPIMTEPHFQPTPQPKNYREYRKLKEEAEKKRKEQEERLKAEERKRQEAVSKSEVKQFE